MISSMLVMVALSKCADPLAGCLCAHPTEWAVVGEVVQRADGMRVVTDGTRFGPAPAEVVVGSEPGTRVLKTEFGELSASSRDEVTCQNVNIDTLTYASAIVEGRCRDTLTSAGYKQPPCRDTFPFCGCSTGAGPALLALALLLRKRR